MLFIAHTNGSRGKTAYPSVTTSGSFKYLGVVIDQHLNFTNNIEHVINKVLFKKIGCSVGL